MDQPQKSALHIPCPGCDALNRVLQDKLTQGPTCGKCHAQLLPGVPLTLTEDRFDKQVLKSGLPVLVDFWAPWCGPCLSMAPGFERAAQLLHPNLRLAKVNTEDEPSLAARFHILSIPTLLLFQNGLEVDRVSGSLDTEALRDWVQSRV